MGTPIFLIRNDGGKIPLMATTLTMNVDRNVVALPMPFFGGSRFAFDLNLPKSLITIEGVMSDDDILNIASVQAEATSIIDFSRAMSSIENDQFVTDDNINAIIEGHALDTVGDADYAIKLTDTLYVWLVQHSTVAYGLSGSRYFIRVHNGTSKSSALQIATNLKDLITTYTSTFNLTASLIDSPISGETDTAVYLTRVNQGEAGNNHPSWDNWANATPLKPYHTQFFGGVNASSVQNKSAGDKVAELFAVLNNSNNGGGGAATIGLLGAGAVAAGTVATGGAAAALLVGGGATFVGSVALLDYKYGDYIIGIQIPFKSNTNSNSSLFYMPTGSFKGTPHKTADNALPVGTKFSAYNGEYTGIKGAIANATFVQLGGEPLFSYTINFIPIDWIF